MIHEEFAKTQVERLSGLRFYDQREPAALRDLVEVVRVMAIDNQDAEGVLTNWLNHERDCPTVADLRAAFREFHEDSPNAVRLAPPKKSNCPICRGTGFQVFEQICTPIIGGQTLIQELSSWQEANDIRDKWKAEREQWMREHPGQIYNPQNHQYLTTAARRCSCRAA
jgi:hypothetical protein